MRVSRRFSSQRQHGFKRVKRAGANIAKHDTQGRKAKYGEVSRGGVGVGLGGQRVGSVIL